MIGYNSNNWYKCVGTYINMDFDFYNGYNRFIAIYGYEPYTIKQLEKMFKNQQSKKIIFSSKTLTRLLNINYDEDINNNNQLVFDTIYNLKEVKTVLIDYYDSFNNIIENDSDECEYLFNETNKLVKDFITGCLYLRAYLRSTHSIKQFKIDKDIANQNKIIFIVDRYLNDILKVEMILIHNNLGLRFLCSDCFLLTHNNNYYDLLDILDNSGSYTRIEKHLLLTSFYEYNDKNIVSGLEKQGYETLLFTKLLNGYTFKEFDKLLKNKIKFDLRTYDIKKIENRKINLDSWDYYHMFGINMSHYQHYIIDALKYSLHILGSDHKDYLLIKKEYELITGHKVKI